MKHKHHIIPRYRGGTDDPSNIIELSPIQHSMYHYANWQLWSDSRDFCAYKMILGDVKNPQFRSHRTKAFGHIMGKKGGKRLHELHPNHGAESNKKQRATLEEQGRTIAEKKWEIVTPTDEVLVITNLAKFCREHNLLKHKMCEVSKGMWKQHKGYKCKKLR